MSLSSKSSFTHEVNLSTEERRIYVRLYRESRSVICGSLLLSMLHFVGSLGLQISYLCCTLRKLWKIPQNTTFIIAFIDVSATAAAFVGMTAHQVLLRWTVSNHTCVEVGRTSRLCSFTCLVFSRCVLLPWSTVLNSVRSLGHLCMF